MSIPTLSVAKTEGPYDARASFSVIGSNIVLRRTKEISTPYVNRGDSNNALPADLPPLCRVGIVFLRMYKDFHATDRWTKKQVHCLYQALIVAVATRHADAVDIKFLVDGRPVWVALPLPAWVEYQKRTNKMITDPLAIEIAGHYLKTALETGEGVGREMYSLTVAETLKHLESLVKEETEATA